MGKYISDAFDFSTIVTPLANELSMNEIVLAFDTADGLLKKFVPTGTNSGILTIIGGGGTGWSITGNAGTVDGTNFLGTTDNIPFNIRVNNVMSGRIDQILRSTFLGYEAGLYSTHTTGSSGQSNTAIGYDALMGKGPSPGPESCGHDSTAVGFQALQVNTQIGNTAIGSRALQSNTIGTGNIGIGWQALIYNTTGSNNVAIGNQALYDNTGNDNTAIGYQALYSNTNATFNVAVGYHAMFLGNSNWNTAVGMDALYSGGGAQNVAIGMQTLIQCSAGYDNTAVGFQSLYHNNANQNTALGFQSLFSNITGEGNTAVGEGALSNNVGDGNTSLGQGAGAQNFAGTYNVFIGAGAGAGTPDAQVTNLTNSIAIGSSAATMSNNSMALGEGVTDFYFGYKQSDDFSHGPVTLHAASINAGNKDVSAILNTLIIAGGQGTGLGDGGSINFKIASAGLTGSSQNPLVDAMLISTSSVQSQIDFIAGADFAISEHGAPSLSNPQNDWSTIGLSNISMLPTGGNYTITGFVQENKILILQNNSTDGSTITLTHEDAGSSVKNRMRLGSGGVDIIIQPHDTITLIYGKQAHRWLLLSESTQNKYATTILNGSIVISVPITITHNLGSTDITAQAWDLDTGDMTFPRFTNRTLNTVDVVFTSVPPITSPGDGDIRIVIMA